MNIEALRLRRLKRRLSLHDVAKAARIFSVSSLSAWERGTRNPKAKHLKAWKRALK